jgi:peptidoglycan/xylan/chitin deacetylase (PgdA/CDA1 family)
VTRVALTFDTEHPGRPYPHGGTGAILDTLAAEGVTATFFLQGRWVRAHPAVAARIAGEGHVVANHSNHHAPMDALSDEWLRRDVARAEETIREFTGTDPRPWFRCPFGSGMDDPRVLAALAELGYEHVGWDVDPEDWQVERTPGDLVQRTLAGVRELGGADAIVLLHGWPPATVAGLGALIGALRGEGAELVTVPALRGY